MKKYKISVIISGGQTGADRGALDFAIKKGIKYGGWCPFGRRAVDKVIPPIYSLKETNTSLYPARTRMNCRDSDATLIFSSDVNSKGTLLTVRFCIEMMKPYHIVVIDKNNLDKYKGVFLKVKCQKVLKWLSSIKPKILNVAGTRESHCVGIQNKVTGILNLILDYSNEEIDWPPAKHKNLTFDFANEIFP